MIIEEVNIVSFTQCLIYTFTVDRVRAISRHIL